MELSFTPAQPMSVGTSSYTRTHIHTYTHMTCYM